MNVKKLTITVFCKEEDLEAVQDHFDDAFENADAMLYGPGPKVEDATPEEAAEAQESLDDGLSAYDSLEDKPNLSRPLRAFLEAVDLKDDATLLTAINDYNKLDLPDFVNYIENYWRTDPALYDGGTTEEHRAVYHNVGQELNALIEKHGHDTIIDWLLSE